MSSQPRKRGRPRSRSVTAGRVARLYRFIAMLRRGPVPRTALLRRLRLNQRGFYRDIELLRTVGIRVTPMQGSYHLVPGFAAAVDMLPFPDPRLSLGEAQQLARGGSPAHRALKEKVRQITRGNSKNR